MTKNELILDLFDNLQKTAALYDGLIKQTDNYGTKAKLHSSELNMIAAVAEYPDSNLNKLSESLGITKGAVSKMVKKLVQKGLVTKQFAANSENEVAVNLTEMGQVAQRNHKLYEKKLNDEILTVYSSLTEKMLAEFSEKLLENQQLLKHLAQENSKS
ncbi:MarR family transcriptional regulator [Oenococcus sicerae]|uniref:MarR family transcriptional regulator n=1 Tax=Oenococcus sicerae TaxID=2203724 RepID=A0AAJ1R9Q9_9LACO|nr:MarR family transcriptional regulator [Oenococcus sicerae]MDN6899608.1 MarR family transcriptional regulator [Oenococcus sicerae]QAS70296.1 MarR family transcriptional regulator [Oenococcus sicerae]